MVIELQRSRKESERMDEELQGGPTRRRQQTFRPGDTVRIVSGPFVSFTGEIEGINQDKALLKVKISIYGRTNPVKLNFSDVEKVSAA
jgi:transcription termination/antitermination protein NusG